MRVQSLPVIEEGMRPLIYLDNNSTTRIDPAVMEAMLPYFTTKFGNASNTIHDAGAGAAEAVAIARGQVAMSIGASPREIVFTSGATESNNLALLGVCRFKRSAQIHVITITTEHKAVLEPCRQLEQEGVKVTYLPVDRSGLVSLQQLEDAIRPETLLISVMAANNEIGTLAPLKEIGALCRRRNILFHSDAAQAVGRIQIDVDDWGVDLLSLSAHKAYGPPGVGALYLRQSRHIGISQLFFGGGQEHGLRSGTLPVPQIVGMGMAFDLAVRRLESDVAQIAFLRNRLQARLEAALPSAVFHGHQSSRLPGLLNVGFPEVDGDVLIQLLRGVAASQGSSCSAGSFEPSHVLRAISVPDHLARASLRLGIGRFNTESEIDAAAELIATAVDRARAHSEN